MVGLQENVLEKKMQKCCLNQDCSLIIIRENKKENECQSIPQTVEEKKWWICLMNYMMRKMI